MNNKELLEDRKRNLLIDLLQSLEITKEDYKFEKNKFPLTSKDFSSHTDDFLHIIEDLKENNLVINLEKWFLNEEPHQEKLQAHHKDEGDIVIGYLEITNLKSGILKIKRLLNTINESKNTSSITSFEFKIDKKENLTHFRINKGKEIPIKKSGIEYKIFWKIFDEKNIVFKTKKELDLKIKAIKNKNSKLAGIGYPDSIELLKPEKINEKYSLKFKNPDVFSKYYSVE